MNFIIIAALVILAFLFLRVRHLKNRVYLLILILAILFVYVTASRVLASHNLDWKSVSDIGKAVKLYFSWLGSTAGNFKTIAGNAVNLDWKINNESLQEMEKT